MTAIGWPSSAEELEELQLELALLDPPTWRPSAHPLVAGAFVASARGLEGVGAAGDPLWAAAVMLVPGEPESVEERVTRGRAGGAYAPGLLALREGELLGAAIASLDRRPDVVLVDGTGRDHPRRAGIALHLGAVLEVPTIGVTVRPLVASPVEPGPERGSVSPLVLGGEVVGAALRTRRGARPVFVHAAWCTGPVVAVEVVLMMTARYRTPEPIRLARRLARTARGAERPADARREPPPGTVPR